MSLDYDSKLRRRQVDHSNRDAEAAISSSVNMVGPWRAEIAQLAAKAARPFYSLDHARLLQRCKELRSSVREVRTNLVADLIDAPVNVRSHGRVIDVEKALDNFEESLAEVEARLSR
jgi:hypothetical protein